MDPAVTNHPNKRLPLLARVVLVVAALAILGFIALGYIVAADLNQAYFGGRSASLGTVDVVAAAGAIYCFLVGFSGRWRIL